MESLAHGQVGKREQIFTHLLPLRANDYDVQILARLAGQMKGDVDTVKDGPDPEENVLVPAGYTYLGQFVDHDLTFDSTSSLDPTSSSSPTNLRSPRFDLDCVYGDGPDAQPFMYDPAGEKLLYKNEPVSLPNTSTAAASQDLLRNPNGRAIIGDKRNDENSIVSQIQLAFIKYHNAVIDELKTRDQKTWTAPGRLFESARNEVRWTYQRLLVEDFLPRIVKAEVLQNLRGIGRQLRAKNYAFYLEEHRGNLPREFVGAAYRFGHSGVRTGYRMNAGIDNRFEIFPASDNATQMGNVESLLGFDPVPQTQVIDNWSRFFPTTPPGVIDPEDRSEAAGDAKDGCLRLQLAYKIDTTVVDPLAVLPRAEVAGETSARESEAAIAPTRLPDAPFSGAQTPPRPPRPSLLLLNLLRGNVYRIQGGQAFARLLHEKGFPAKPLRTEHMVTRNKVAGEGGLFQYVPIPKELHHDTPLWYYILAEAQAPLVDHFGHAPFDEKELLTGIGAKAQLGWVGGRIVAEVFYGLLDSDAESFVNAAPPSWVPILGGDGSLVFRNLLKFADASNS